MLGSGERGRYLLSATFGNVHGRHRPGNVVLRPASLGEIVDDAGVVRADCGLGDKRADDPRTWRRSAEHAMARVVEACHQRGSAGRSLTGR